MHTRAKAKPAAKCFPARLPAPTSGAAKQQENVSLDAYHHSPASPEQCRGRAPAAAGWDFCQAKDAWPSPRWPRMCCQGSWHGEGLLLGVLFGGAAQESQMPPVRCPGYLESATIAPAGAGQILKPQSKVLDGILQLQCCWSHGKPTAISPLPAKTLLCTELLPQAPAGFVGTGAPTWLMSGTPARPLLLTGSWPALPAARVSPDPICLPPRCILGREGVGVVTQHLPAPLTTAAAALPNRKPRRWRAQHRPRLFSVATAGPEPWHCSHASRCSRSHLPSPAGSESTEPTRYLPPSALVATHPSERMFITNSQPPEKKKKKESGEI